MAGGAKPPRNVAAIISENRAVANNPQVHFTAEQVLGVFSDEQLKRYGIAMKIKHLTCQQVLNKSFDTTNHWAKEKHRHGH